MEVGRVAFILNIASIMTSIQVVEGQEDFFGDFIKFLDTEGPMFISSEQVDEDLNRINMNSSTAFIRYSSNEEEKVAFYLNELYTLGDLTMVVFLNTGHQKLLSLLMNNLDLFKRGLIGLVPESDVTTELDISLHLNTRLYLYANWGTIDVFEMYAVNGNTIVSKIGQWNAIRGLTVPTKNMWERRTSMEGATIRVATINIPFYHELSYDKSGTSIIGGGGFLLEPLNMLATKLNFTIKLMPSKDGKWGTKDSNGTWNGMIGMLIKHQADMAGASLTITKERAQVITFGMGLVEEKITLISAQNVGPQANPWIYLEIFPKTVWHVSCAMVIITALCFTTINHFGISYMHYTHDSEKFTLLNGLGLSMTFFRQIYYDVNIKGMTTRILFILSAVSTYLLYVHYTAYLTAASTSFKDNSIKSFGDVLSGGYNVFVWEHTTQHDDLKNAKPGTAMHEVYYNTMVDNPRAFVQSVEEVSQMWNSQKVLYYGTETDTILYSGLTSMDIQGLSYVNFTARA